MLRRTVIVLLVIAGCKSSNGTVDAPAGGGGGGVDAKVFHDARPPDAKVFMDAAGATCTGLLYDACNPAASNCQGATTCHNFAGRGFSVCTQTCSNANPCPAQNGTAVTCNNMGVCIPNAPNSDCTSP